MNKYDVIVHEVVRKVYVVEGIDKNDAEENYLYDTNKELESEKYIDEEIVNVCKRPKGLEFHRLLLTKEDVVKWIMIKDTM